jgi:hypothetical protein
MLALRSDGGGLTRPPGFRVPGGQPAAAGRLAGLSPERLIDIQHQQPAFDQGSETGVRCTIGAVS